MAPLLGEDRNLRDDAEGKAERLKKQFTSVFSKLFKTVPSCYPDAPFTP